MSRSVAVLLLAPTLFLVHGCAKQPVAPDPAVVGSLMQPPAAEASASYRMQIGDELHVRFTYQPEMNEQVPVRPDGRITLATTGERSRTMLVVRPAGSVTSRWTRKITAVPR